jgi:glycosyltransferase involved in cell wall biosynthesis
MEAMAMGVPVIGADVRGIRDLIGSGAGILVPVGDATGLASAMQVMADNPQAASTFGKHGVREIQRYGIDTITAAHEELYATALVRSGFPLAHGLRCVSV